MSSYQVQSCHSSGRVPLPVVAAPHPASRWDGSGGSVFSLIFLWSCHTGWKSRKDRFAFLPACWIRLCEGFGKQKLMFFHQNLLGYCQLVPINTSRVRSFPQHTLKVLSVDSKTWDWEDVPWLEWKKHKYIERRTFTVVARSWEIALRGSIWFPLHIPSNVFKSRKGAVLGVVLPDFPCVILRRMLALALVLDE